MPLLHKILRLLTEVEIYVFLFCFRYLTQVMIDFPKPIVAALKKPAQGLGAKLVSLCDLVCDEVRLYMIIVIGTQMILISKPGQKNLVSKFCIMINFWAALDNSGEKKVIVKSGFKAFNLLSPNSDQH